MVSSLWYEANLKVFKVIIHMPLLVHGLHPQILFGLVRALNVVIVPTQHIFGFRVCGVVELPVFARRQSLFSSVVLNALQCLKTFRCDSMRSMIISFTVGEEPTLISKSMQGPLCMLMMLAPRSVKKVFR